MRSAPASDTLSGMRTARKGDWIQVHAIGGGPPQRGQVVEVIGRRSHERYRVRWDEQHETIHYPRGGGSTAERILPRWGRS